MFAGIYAYSKNFAIIYLLSFNLYLLKGVIQYDGKFSDSDKFIWLFTTLFVLALVGGPLIFFSEFGEGAAYLLSFLLIILSIAVYLPFTHGSFAADEEKVVFRLGFITYTYKYSEIEFAETQTGFSHGGYGSRPYVKIDIYLKGDDEPETFYDRIPNDALSTPEKHKKFYDEHRFTILCSFIIERVSRNLL